MEMLKKKHPEKKLSLLMGFDSFLNLATWTRAEDLLPMVHCVYVASRLEKDAEQARAVEEIQKTCANLKVVFLGHHQHEDVSSTNLRKKAP